MKQESVNIPKLVDEKGNPYEIPLEGSLGLLALGYMGVLSWRAHKKVHKNQNLNKEDTSQNTKSNKQNK